MRFLSTLLTLAAALSGVVATTEAEYEQLFTTFVAQHNKVRYGSLISMIMCIVTHVTTAFHDV